MPTEKYLLITKAAPLLNRSPRTLRDWEDPKSDGPKLPEELRPIRNERNQRLYTLDQIDHIREWMIAHDMRPARNAEIARAALARKQEEAA